MNDVLQARLVYLFYKLVRDHTPASVLTTAIKEGEAAEGFIYTNPHLEAFARDLVARLEKT